MKITMIAGIAAALCVATQASQSDDIYSYLLRKTQPISGLTDNQETIDAIQRMMRRPEFQGLNGVTDEATAIEEVLRNYMNMESNKRSTSSTAGLISDLNLLRNVVGGKDNRLQALSGFGGSGSGSFRRSDASDIAQIALLKMLESDTTSMGGLVSDLDLIKNVVGGQRNRLEALDGFEGSSSGAFRRSTSSMGGLLSDINIVKNIIGGEDNRLQLLDGAKGTASGSFRRSTSSMAGLLSDINIVKNLIGGEDNRLQALSGFEGAASGAFRRSESGDFSELALLMAIFQNDQPSTTSRGGLISDLNIAKNLVGGENNRLEALDDFKGTASGAF